MYNRRSRRVSSHTDLNFRLMFVGFLLQWSCQNKGGISAQPLRRVVGGTPAPRGRFPYICSLRRRGNREHICGGTLIKSQWVLTAAHCLEGEYAGTSPMLYCGIYERDERNASKVFAADRTYVHLQWNGNVSEGYDLALIKLDRSSNSPLPDLVTRRSLHTSGTVFSALGWGRNSSGGFTDLLQIANRLPFVSARICNQGAYWDNQIMDSMICAGTGEQDTDQGDSGGPLLQLDFPNGDYTLGQASYDLLVGITSFGENSRVTFKPGVYTSVSYFRDWIDCIMEETENCSRGNDQAIEPLADEEGAVSASRVNTPLAVPTSQPAPYFELSSISSEAFAELSEEDLSDLDTPDDPCAGITANSSFNETSALTRIREAIEEDDSETVAEILCMGLSPNLTFSSSMTENNQSLLHEAAKHDSLDSATILIDLGSNIEKTNGFPGSRPLHVAAQYNSAKVAKLLIDSGADIEAKDRLRYRPLQIAAFQDSEDVAKLLIEAGSNIESSSALMPTPLDAAIEEDSSAVARLLLDSGADIQSRNYVNQTYLHRAASHNATEVTKILIEFGANVSSLDSALETPLHYAASWGSLGVAEVLVDNGAVVDVQNDRGRTPLHNAARNNRLEMAEFLIDHGASKRVEDNDGDTPFDIVCESVYSLCNAHHVTALQTLLRNE